MLECGGWAYWPFIEPHCINTTYQQSTKTHACVGNPWNLRNLVPLSRLTALRIVSGNDVCHTGRQWKKAICVLAKCRPLMGCCITRATEIPISCSAGTLKLERRYKVGVLIVNTLNPSVSILNQIVGGVLGGWQVCSADITMMFEKSLGPTSMPGGPTGPWGPRGQAEPRWSPPCSASRS